MENNKIVEVLINATINEEKIKTINVKNSAKPLGVCMSPILSWKDGFECAKQKMKDSIKRVMKEDTKLLQVCLCFSMHALTNMFFWMWNSEFQ